MVILFETASISTHHSFKCIITYFFLMRIVPIEPAEVILRLSGVTPTTESIRSLEKKWG